jgi:hypothetical protein
MDIVRIYDEVSHMLMVDNMKWCMQKFQDELNCGEYKLFQTHPAGHFSVLIQLRFSPIFAVDPPSGSGWLPRFWTRYGRPNSSGTALRYSISAVHPEFAQIASAQELLTVRNIPVPETLVCQQLTAVEEHISVAYSNMVIPVQITLCAVVVQHFASRPFRERGRESVMNMEENTIMVLGISGVRSAPLQLWDIMGFHPLGLPNCPSDAGLLTVRIHLW